MTLSKVLMLFLFCSAGMAVWSEEPRQTNPATPRERIVFLGDSITAGYGVDPGQAYPALLQAKIDAAHWPFEVANAGVSGDTTAGGLRRVDWALSRGAAVLVVALGGNDGLRGIAPKQTAENLRGIAERARQKIPDLPIVLAGMQMPANLGADYVNEFKSIFPTVAKETNAALVPFLLEGVGGKPELNQADMIHPNPAGHAIVAENVWRVLEGVLRQRMVQGGQPK